MADLIPGGYILLARKTLNSGIMEKPPFYIKVWLWMLLQASFKDHGNLKRGQFFTSLALIQDAMSHKIGYRTVKPTIKEIRGVTKFLTKVSMIVTTKVTHGMIITICNYDYYQNFQNYEGHNEGHAKGHIEGTILRKKGFVNKGNNTISASNDAVSGNGFFVTKKKRKLLGKRLETFNLFWEAFDYKRGKAEAADAWLDIPELTDTLVGHIIKAAEIEAKHRQQLISDGRTPKMAQGWLSGRRWEDEYTPIIPGPDTTGQKSIKEIRAEDLEALYAN